MSRADLTVRPIVRDKALAWLRQHRHLPPPRNSWLLGAAVCEGERLCAIATVERPARMAQDGVTACVSRLCTDRTEHAASKALAAVTRACLALGYRRVLSYTLLGEAGTCYLAAGWVITGLVEASQGWHSRAGRTVAQGGAKVRWETGPDAKPADGAAALVAGWCVGRVEIAEYRDVLPLLRGVA